MLYQSSPQKPVRPSMRAGGDRRQQVSAKANWKIEDCQGCDAGCFIGVGKGSGDNTSHDHWRRHDR